MICGVDMSVYGVLVVGSSRNDENHMSWIGRFCPDIDETIGVELFKSEEEAAWSIKDYAHDYSYRVMLITPSICKKLRKNNRAKFMELMQ
jgi:hypothetical protein